MKHLLDDWATVSLLLSRASRLLLMLDLDGTLAPIVPHPPDARIPARTLEALHSLAGSERVTLALISGRSAGEVQHLAGLTDVHYFGCHGRERIRPGRTAVEADDRFRSAVAEFCRSLENDLRGISGLRIEDKSVAAAAHYRNVGPRDHPRVQQGVHRAAELTGLLRVSRGKMVYDVTPLDGIDKGVAALTLLKETGGLPLYFGDDTTDESAFGALPPDAVTVFVGPGGTKSKARFRVTHPGEVGRALERILDALAT